MIDGRFQLVAIPMRDHHTLTRSLVGSLVDDGEADRIIVFDNDTRTRNGVKWLRRVAQGRYGDTVEVRRRTGDAIIYRLWNEAWKYALALGDELGVVVDLTILNNDISVPPGFVGHLSRALRHPDTPDDVWITYPNYRRRLHEGVQVGDPPQITPTFGTYRKKGMSGFAFMMKPEKHRTAEWPLIDEKFRWLCGDGDLCSTMQERGATAAKVVGLPMEFQTRTSSGDGRNHHWVSRVAHEDLRHGKAKWGHGTRTIWRENWADWQPLPTGVPIPRDEGPVAIPPL